MTQAKRITEKEFTDTWRQAREDVRELMEGVALLLPTLDRLYYGVVTDEDDEAPRKSSQRAG